MDKIKAEYIRIFNNLKKEYDNSYMENAIQRLNEIVDKEAKTADDENEYKSIQNRIIQWNITVNKVISIYEFLCNSNLEIPNPTKYFINITR